MGVNSKPLEIIHCKLGLKALHKMMNIVTILTVVAASSLASALPNWGCQCNDLTYVDDSGRIHGNCQTDYNGAKWCFVPSPNTCTDFTFSTRGPWDRMDSAWSYEACTTGAPPIPCERVEWGCL